MKTLFSFLFCCVALPGFSQVDQIATVVHVLWNHPSDNIPDSLVHNLIENVNKDWRRQNDDTAMTPACFLPVAADMEIELVLASEDPLGNPTTGITNTFTDSTEFSQFHENIKNSFAGGKTPWDTDYYLNIWVHPRINLPGSQSGGITLGYSSMPGFPLYAIDGVVVRTDRLESGAGLNHRWRTLTHELGHFFCLGHTVSIDSCYDADGIADTPMAMNTFWGWECDTVISTCNNGPCGDMFMNYMHYSRDECQNMFTLGQRDFAGTCIDNHYPLLRESPGLGISPNLHIDFSIHPNPTTSSLQLTGINSGNYSILNLSGKAVDSGTLISRSGISVEQLPAGLYILKVQIESGVGHQRFVKQ